MIKTVKAAFVTLSLVLVCALCFACIQIGITNPKRDDSSVEASEAEESTPESSVNDSSIPESSEDESSEDESSEDESSEDESSEDESSVTPVGNTDPVTPPPSSISSSPYDSYFDNSIFVGHSVMVHFKNYVSNWRTSVDSSILGNAAFGCTSSFSFFNNLNQTPSTSDNVLPRLAGLPYNIENLPKASNTSTIYLSLMGLNDLGMVGKPSTCARLVTDEVVQTIDKIKEENPDVTIVVLASTYLVRGKSFPNLNNPNMSLLNSYVLEYCNQNGMDFVDVAAPLTNGDGYLADVYCSDNYCHLRQTAYYVWMDVLRDYAKQKAEGTWVNPQSITLIDN